MAHALDRVVEAELLKNEDDFRILFAGAGAAQADCRTGARSWSFQYRLSPMQQERVPDVWSLCDAALVHLKDDPASRK